MDVELFSGFAIRQGEGTDKEWWCRSHFVNELQEQLAEAKTILRDLEWSHQEGFNDPPGIVRCPICGNTKSEGHDHDCRLFKLINVPEVSP